MTPVPPILSLVLRRGLIERSGARYDVRRRSRFGEHFGRRVLRGTDAAAKEATPVLGPCVQAASVVRAGFSKYLAAGQLGPQGIGIDSRGRSCRALSGLTIAMPELDGGRGDRG